MKPPCYGCQDRKAGCHAECGRYLEWHEKQRERTAVIKREKARERDANSFRYGSVAKVRAAKNLQHLKRSRNS